MISDFARSIPCQLFSVVALSLSFVFAVDCQSQDVSRRPLEHKDYDVWNTMSSSAISNDGNWVMYRLQNGAIEGEATLYFQSTTPGKEYVIPRGTDARFSSDSRFAMYLITPEKTKVKKLQKQKKEKHEWPKTRLQILNLEKGTLINVENVRSFKRPKDDGSWVACLLEQSNDSNSLEERKSQANESYEVTPEGLRRPAKKFKLKSRRQLALERGQSVAESPEKQPQQLTESKKTATAKGEVKKPAHSDDDDGDSKNDKKPGTPLVLIDLESRVQRIYPDVESFAFSGNGKTLAFSTSIQPSKYKESETSDETKESPDRGPHQPTDGLHVVDLDSLTHRVISQGEGQYKSFVFNESGTDLAFITNKDDYESETPAWTLYHWNSRAKGARKIAEEGSAGLPEGWWVSPNSSQRFSEDGRRLFFEIAPVPQEVMQKRKTNGDDSEVEKDDDDLPKLDVWHWQDPQLQPQQLLQAEVERKRDYRAVYEIKTKKVVQLATRQIPVVDIDYRSSANVAVANTNMRYRKTLSWDVPGLQDAYLVNLGTGKSELVLEAVKWDVQLSPEGKYLTWFDAQQKAWFAKSTKRSDQEPVQISKGIKFALYDELHDRPMLPNAYGSPGWLTGDSAMLVYDRYDIWKLDPTGANEPTCVTSGFGRANDLRFRYLKLDPESRAIDPAKPVVLSAFGRKSKASGFYVLDPPVEENAAATKTGKESLTSAVPRRLILLDERITGLQKAKESDRVIFTRSTFRKCPDLWSSDTNFRKIFRVSDMNPQQDEYAWGDAELVQWKSSDGRELDGILLKPDGFDASKEYPMIVYFYERNSDNLHRYYTPAAGRSIICHSFYVSRGYLVFIPDIPYSIGEPGPSAANSVIPGVESLIKRGFVDRDRIGMQGHSWGGYQTAYLVTKTDMFACAESGAPVSNMTSAYGGIRWGSGLSRMFQYERTQSRIGEDLWAAREKYVANSPLFFADKINTPLLILHNDEDGAVPWYQGIELFVALRRLEKPAWMLNYNGDPHWVMGEPNRRDFATRMQQFFDHYLLDAPEPEWMAVGVSAVDKGKKLGLELLEPENQKAVVNE